jgi:hypothetical protein
VLNGPPFPPQALVTRSDGSPILFPVLGVFIQLEPPQPDDVERYRAAAALVRDWIGSELRWTLTTTFSVPEKFRASDLDYFEDHARASIRPPTSGDVAIDRMQMRLQVKSQLDFSMSCYGAEEDDDASPFSFHFHSEVPDDKSALSMTLPTSLLVTVPTDWPLEDFRQRALALIATLRVRWANAGLTYSGADDQAYVETHQATFAHARRYPGFDMPEFVELGLAFHDRIRSVNWLTVLGPALLVQPLPVATSDSVQVFQVGNCLALQAGEAPSAGDINRLIFPPGYQAADAMVRKVRSPRPTDSIHFLHPWDADTSARWLRRFEHML